MHVALTEPFQTLPPQRVLIAGCGKIGSALAQMLVALGHEVTGLRRSPDHGSPGVRCLQVDLTDPAQCRAITDSYDAVFYILTPGGRTPDAYRNAYLLGQQNLMQRLAELGPMPHWTLVSSTSVYGQQAGEWVDETTPTDPTSATAAVLLQAEKWLRSQLIRHTIVRFAGIYGPGRMMLIKQACSGQPVAKQPPVYTNRIHQVDAVGALAFLLQHRLTGAEQEDIYLVCDDNPATQWEVMTWLAEQLGLPEPPALTASPDAPQNKRCSNRRLKQLGFRWRYPDFRMGYAEMLADSGLT